MNIHPIAPDDIPDYQRIVSQSFQRGRPATFGADILEQTDRARLGVYEDGRLQATLGILDFEMFFGADRRPCGGIFGVTCDPAMRGRGYAGALLRRALERMRERGQYLSSLWPFDYRYYRRFGWEWTGRSPHYSVPVKLMAASEETRYVETLHGSPAEMAAALNPLYEAMATRYNGALVRTEKMWEDHLARHGERDPGIYVYRRGGQMEGCAIVRYTDDEKVGRVSQLLHTSERAYRGLLGLLAHHGMTVERFVWDAPQDDPLWSLVFNWPLETKLKPCGMSRIVDVERALASIRPDETARGGVTVEISDESAPWNAGTWRIEAESGRLVVARDERAKPDLSLDIQALTQAYWGTPSLHALRPCERLAVHHESAFALLAALLPPRTAWLYDDF